MIKRLITSSPIESKYSGICTVCKKTIDKQDQISPFFDGERNLWRHTECFQLFYLSAFKYPGECKDCIEEIQIGEAGYWSKHNGVWCVDCGEALIPNVVVSFSREQDLNMTIRRLRA